MDSPADGPRVLALGEAALLVEPRGSAEGPWGSAEGPWGSAERALATLALCAALELERPDGVIDLVPAQTSVLVRIDTSRTTVAAVAAWVRGVRSLASGARAGVTVEVPVVYDGEDLAEVAAVTGLDQAEVVRAHTGRLWTVAFSGFAPGFAYLVGGDPRLLGVPRRAVPRVRVPAGAVGLAGAYSGVYPRASPGGWQIIGRTGLPLWDVAAAPPALLRPGVCVQFVSVAPKAVRGLRSGTSGSRDQKRPPEPVVGVRGLRVVRAGPLTTVQDLGRPGLGSIGVTASGAADRASFRLANRLVGNRERAAALEITLGGFEAMATGALTVCVTGAACPLLVDGRASPRNAVLHLADGAVLAVGQATAGVRAYLGVRGGVAVAEVLGSRATDTLAGLGPPQVASGGWVPVGEDVDGWPLVDAAPAREAGAGPVVLRAVPGPRTPQRAGALEGVVWTVSPDSDRVGLRLSGPSPALLVGPLAQAAADFVGPSEGLVRGAVQMPPSGQPVIFMADHPVTGGYPVLACLLEPDADVAAQLRPGQAVRLSVLNLSAVT